MEASFYSKTRRVAGYFLQSKAEESALSTWMGDCLLDLVGNRANATVCINKIMKFTLTLTIV